MKFSTFELRVLKSINGSFPIPYDPNEKSMIATGERPLMTVEKLASAFPKTV